MASVARPSDRWIPWYFVIFFVLLALLLGSFCWIAFHTFTGEITQEGYKKGLKYNTVLKEAESQAALGWKSSLDVATQGQTAIIAFRLNDAQGKQLDGAEVLATYVRSTQAGHDVQIQLKSETPGIYKGEAELPLPGVWELHISVTKDGHHFQTMKTIVTK